MVSWVFVLLCFILRIQSWVSSEDKVDLGGDEEELRGENTLNKTLKEQIEKS